MSRVTIDIDDKVWKELKIKAYQEGITVKSLVNSMLGGEVKEHPQDLPVPPVKPKSQVRKPVKQVKVVETVKQKPKLKSTLAMDKKYGEKQRLNECLTPQEQFQAIRGSNDDPFDSQF